MPVDDFTLGPADIYPRQRALFDDFEAYLFRETKRLYDSRGRFWNRDFASPEAYEKSVEPNRQHWLAALGGWPWDRQDLGLRTERLHDFGAFTLDRVTYRLFDKIDTDGLLCTPKGKGPFPALVCQVGVNGPPERILGFEEGMTTWQNPPYRAIGRRLAEHGYCVLGTRMTTGFDPKMTRDLDHRAPHLMTAEEEEIRQYLLQKYGKDAAKKWAPYTKARNYMTRLCRVIGRDLMGMEMFCLSRGVDVLASLPQVDPARIGFYGLSQGGMSALFLGPLEKRFKAVVSSMCFNERYTKQVVKTEPQTPFLLTAEENHLYPTLTEFSDSDLGSLVCPRCFFVEAGRQDGSVHWRFAAQAFAEVQAIYDRLGIGDRCGMFIHEGEHEVEPLEDTATIHFVQFLDRWLK